MKKTPPTTSLIALASAALVLQGCSTTYVGSKMPADGSRLPGDTGMPHTLTRHEFTLNVAPDAVDPTKPVYMLVRNLVPDPKQRYSLTLSPGLFTDGTFSIDYGTMGNLTNADASTSSQVVATVKSLASLAADFINAKALKDESGVWTKFMEVLKDPNIPECAAPAGYRLVKYEAELQASAKAKLAGTAKDAAEAAKLQTVWVADRFHYRTREELTCLTKARDALVAAAPKGQDAARQSRDAAENVASANSADDKLLKKLRGFVTSYDLSGVMLTLDSFDANTTATVKTAYEDAKEYLNNDANLKRARLLVNFYVDMPLDVWRARHLVQVESDIEQLRLKVFVSPNDSESQRKLQAALAERRVLVGRVDLEKRLAALDAQLTSTKPGDGEGRSQMSVDRERVQAVWDQTRTDLLAKNVTFDLAPKDKPQKIQSKENLAVTVMTSAQVDAFSGPVKDDTPRFVLVLEEVPSPTPMKDKSAQHTAEKGNK